MRAPEVACSTRQTQDERRDSKERTTLFCTFDVRVSVMSKVLFLLLTLFFSSSSAADGKRGRRLDPVPIVPQGPATGEYLNIDSDAKGIVKIVLTEDSKVIDSAFYDTKYSLLRPDAGFPLRQMSKEGCSVELAIPACGGNLSLCLALDITNMNSVCSCYRAHATCWAAAGCPDNVPKEDADYCTYNLKCNLVQCTGSGAWTVHASGAALFAILFSSIALAFMI